MVDTDTYDAMEAALLGAIEAGRTPTHWTLTWELYRQLDYPGDHFATADRAIHYGEEPNPLYQLPVRLQAGAHHAWELEER